MTNVFSFKTRRAITVSGAISTATIQHGSNRASFVDRVLHAARAGKAAFEIGDKVADKNDPTTIGTVLKVHHAAEVEYLVSFGCFRCIVGQSRLQPAGA